MQEFVAALAAALALCLSLYLIYFVFAKVGDMAKARGHSPWPWWFISLAWSPFGSMFVLWLFFRVQHTNIGSQRRRY
jgi:uncharacterized RDD family membrane protein YckC